MELKDLVRVFRKHLKRSLAFSMVLAAVVFVVASILPPSYKATATFYIKREKDPSNLSYFTYEGYYAMQTAEKYADTVIGLLRSPDIRKQALVRLGLTVSAAELSKLEDRTLIKRAGPQLVSMSVTGPSQAYSAAAWNALSASLVERVRLLNVNGDNRLAIEVVETSPIVTEVRPFPALYTAAAFLFGMFAGLFAVSLKEYLK